MQARNRQVSIGLSQGLHCVMGELVLMLLIGFSCAFAGWLMVYAAARWEKESRLAREAVLANDLLLTTLDQARSATQRGDARAAKPPPSSHWQDILKRRRGT